LNIQDVVLSSMCCINWFLSCTILSDNGYLGIIVVEYHCISIHFKLANKLSCRNTATVSELMGQTCEDLEAFLSRILLYVDTDYLLW